MSPVGGFLLLLAGSIAAVAAAPPARSAATLPYTVARGDTLDALARRYLIRPGTAAALPKLLHVRRPRALTVGRVLAIPAALVARTPLGAHIERFSGDVRMTLGGRALPVTVGAAVPEGADLVTATNAFVAVVFADDSRLSLPSASHVTIAALHRFKLGDADDRRFVVHDGRSSYDVTPLAKPADRFEVRTPMAVAAVRGTEFRVAFDAAAAQSRLEVLSGRVAESGATDDVAEVAAGAPAEVAAGAPAEVAAGAQVEVAAGAPVEVAAGSGASRTPAGRVVAALLPAPDLDHSDRVQDEPAVRFVVAHAVAGRRYRFQLARDAGMTDLFDEAVSSDGAVSFAGVANGTLFVRVSAIDAGGLEGKPAVYGFDRALAGLAGSVAPAGGRTYAFKWTASGEGTKTFRFILARHDDLSDRLVDLPGLTVAEIAVTALPPGTWYWQVEMTRTVGPKTFRRALKVNELRVAGHR